MEQEIMNTEEMMEVAEVAEETVVNSGNGLKAFGITLAVIGAAYGTVKLVKWIVKKVKSKKNSKETVIEADYEEIHDESVEEAE